MKKIFIALALFIAIATQGQTNTITSQLKLGTVNTGSTSDDILVRGTDKIVKKITVSDLLSSIPAQVNADWNATSGTAQILNKPEIPSVSGLATSTYVDDQLVLKVDKVAGERLINASEITNLSNQSNVNSGDSAININYSDDYRAANFVAGTDYLSPSGSAGGLTGFPVASSTVSGIVDNTSLQELGGVDKLINTVRVGKGSGTGAENIILGDSPVMSLNTTGTSNTAVGFGVMVVNTIGQYNNVFGNYSMRANTTGSFNTALGGAALRQNISGSYNTAVGLNALNKNTVGSYSTALGGNALINSTGDGNIGIGNLAGSGITTGTGNVVVASRIAASGIGGITTGSNNLILSQNDGNITGVTTGSGNTIIGKVTALATALTNTLVISDGVGTKRLISDYTNLSTLPAQTTALITGDATGKAILTKESIRTINGNSLIGTTDLVIAASLPNGMLRTAGSGAITGTLQQITDNTNVLTPIWISTNGITSTGNTTNTSKLNTCFGQNAGLANISGTNNTFFGSSAGLTTTAGSNTAIGGASFSANTTGTNNTIIGRLGYGLATGSKNVVIGDSAGYGPTTGDDNIYIGYNCARGGTSGNNNIIIGSGSSGLDTGSNYNVVVGVVSSAAKAVLQNNVILADGQGNKRMQIDATGKTNLLGEVSAVIAGVYEDNAAATAGGVPVNTFYRTSTGVLMIRY